MDSSSSPTPSCSSGSHTTLMALAQQLRMYRPPLIPGGDDDETEDLTVAERSERFRPKRAAVLVCIFEGDSGEFRVILTKRSTKLSTHPGYSGKYGLEGSEERLSDLTLRYADIGEVVFPGGKADESDANDAETATREAQEEIGLDPSLVDVVTTLEPFLSKHLLKVIPVIGILSDKKAFCPSPNAAEVEAVFDAPLEMFLKDENRRSEEREWMGDTYLINFFDYEMGSTRYLIRGLTAAVLIKAASVVYQRSPAFLEQNPKFKMPRIVDGYSTM